MDKLSKYHSVDIQWGNHDIVWMGAAAGQLACIATAIRNSIRYGNLDLIEEGYGINMLPLATFAMKEYADDSCRLFGFKVQPSGTNNEENDLTRKMHKAIAIIRFKLEGQMMKKWPEYGLENRVMLEKIDYEKGTICIDGKIFKMKDMNFYHSASQVQLTEEYYKKLLKYKDSYYMLWQELSKRLPARLY